MMKLIIDNRGKAQSRSTIKQQKQIKGGFKMKPTRFLIVAIVLLGMVATASALTPAGVTISNKAYGNYKDAAGTSLTQVESNVVETVVSQVAGATFDAAQTATMSSMSSTVYAVEFQNKGNGDDNFTFSATGAVTGTGTYSIELFHDLDGDGILDAAEITDALTWEDTTGVIAMDEIYRVLVRVTDTKSGGSPAGDLHTVTLTATSAFVETPTDLVVTSTVQLATTIAAAAINGETVIIGTPSYEPSTPIVYESCFTNDGTEAGNNLEFVTVMPSNTTLDVNSVSIDGGVNFVTVTVITTGTSSDTYVYNSTTRTLTVQLGNLAVDATICLRYSAIIDPNTGAGEPIEFPADNPELSYENPDGDTYPPVNPSEDTETFPPGGADVAQVYDVDVDQNGTADTTSLAGVAGTEFTFAFSVTNTGNGTDNFNLSGLTENNGQDDDFFTSWTFYLDEDGDGVLDPGETTTVTSTGNMDSGDELFYIAVGTLPGGTADADADNVSFSATSQGDTGVSDAETITITCQAPVILSGTGGLLKAVSPTGNQPPGTTLTYTLSVTNSGSAAAADVVVTDHVPENTTLVAGQLTLAGSGVTDSAGDSDGGSATTSGGDHGKGVVTFSVGSLDPEETVTMTFKVTID
jgi:uncharacterized repeat protein (TIGR01451 family)